jgi:hypothetical protein
VYSREFWRAESGVRAKSEVVVNKSKLARQISALSQFATSGETASFANDLTSLLKVDFSFWLQTVKEHKLVSQFRSSDHIRDLRQKLLTPNVKDILKSPDIEALGHHLDVCEFMQELFGYIDVDLSGYPKAANEGHLKTGQR